MPPPDLQYLKPFFEPPPPGVNFRARWIKKNREHLASLVRKKDEILDGLFDEIKALGQFFSDTGSESTAILFVCKAAANIADRWQVPVLCEMLFWKQILNAPNAFYVNELLGGVDREGHLQDIAALAALRRHFAKAEKLGHFAPTGTYVKSPSVARLLQKLPTIMKNCSERGLRRRAVAQ